MNKNKSVDVGNWKQYPSMGFPYKSIKDPKYIKERNSLFKENGNGWWWGWTKENCPIEDMEPHLKHLYDLREIERKKEIDDRCDS